MEEKNPVYIPGYWMGTRHNIDGLPIQCFMYLHQNGKYERSYEYPDGRKTDDKGTWQFHAREEGTKDFHAGILSYCADADDKDEEERWWIHAISGCEKSNCLLVLRPAILASRNLPWLFYRIHLPSVVVFSGTDREGEEVIALLEEKDISACCSVMNGNRVDIVVEGEVDARNARKILKGREP